ncbi:Uncharacterised protein [Bacteroides ovatus]|nr:Uncharacterised protein [Bacteroides ovatus]
MAVKWEEMANEGDTIAWLSTVRIPGARRYIGLGQIVEPEFIS